MRTEEFLEGYDSCRKNLQEIIACNELQENEKLLELAQYPYDKEDGKDWCVDCWDCTQRGWDPYNGDYCKIGIDINKIGDSCPRK